MIGEFILCNLKKKNYNGEFVIDFVFLWGVRLIKVGY